MSKKITDSKVIKILDCETHIYHVSCGSGINMADGAPIVIITRTTGTTTQPGLPLETECTFFNTEDRDDYFRRFDEAAARAWLEHGLNGLNEVMSYG